MKKTLIIFAWVACGKSYLTKHQKDYGMEILDADWSDKDWPFDDVPLTHENHLEKALSFVGKVDFILLPLSRRWMAELKKKNIPYLMVLPAVYWKNEKEARLIKQQWFGRIALRDNSFIQENFKDWVKRVEEQFDALFTPDNLDFVDEYAFPTWDVLEQHQYLSDIIKEWYHRKETYPNTYDAYSALVTLHHKEVWR